MEKPVALITGAGRGIGRAAAIDLAQRGYRLVLAARTFEELEETCRLAGCGTAIAADVTDPDEVTGLVTRALGASGRIDALVHCAGLAPAVSVEQMTHAQWREVLDVNLSSAFYLAKALWPVFTKQQGGVMVFISSFASRDPFPGFAAYAAAKAGLNLLTRVMAREGESAGIRVHAIAPAAVETAMFRELFTNEQFPAEKALTPADVARVIGGCVSGGLRYTSGEVIFVSRTVG